MSKKNFIRTREHLNIGTIGHVDHGKTTLTAAITKVLSKDYYYSPTYAGRTRSMAFANIDKTPEERARGITINSAHVEYESLFKHYAHIDCPGHQDYIKNMITGATQMDCAILVISAVEGIQPQTVEHVLLAKEIGIEELFIYINKVDVLDPEERNGILGLLEFEIDELVFGRGYETDFECYYGSAHYALLAEWGILFDAWKEAATIRTLIDHIDLFSIVNRELEEVNNFLMPIEGVFSIPGRGTVATGCIESGKVKLGDEIYILGFNQNKKTTCTGVEMFNKILEEGLVGENVGILLRGIKRTEIRRGQVIASSDLPTFIEFHARILVLAEGGRKKPFFINYSPQFYFRTIDVTGTITDIYISDQGSVQMLLPGGGGIIVVNLIFPVVLQISLRFTMREGNITIGHGYITKTTSRK